MTRELIDPRRPATGRRDRPPSLAIDLHVPSAAFTFPGLGTFDGIEALLGVPLETVLGGVLRAPRARSRLSGVVPMECWPLALPGGVGVELPLGRVGALGLFSAQDGLELAVPFVAVSWVERALAEDITRGQAYGPTRPPGGAFLGPRRFTLLPTPGKAYTLVSAEAPIVLAWPDVAGL